MANTAFFWKLIHKPYVRGAIGNEAYYQQKLQLTQERLQNDWDLLEIGCGSGNTALAHAPFVKTVTATDFCAQMMDHGKTRAQDEQIDNIEFQTISLADLPVEQTYDAVLMLSVVHLIPDWKAAIAKAARLTRPGGIYVTSTVTIKDQSMMMRIVGHVVNILPVLPSLKSISRTQLVQQMETNGLSVEVNEHPTGADSSFIIARKPA
jgi:ubiquinone/menaquinone biosynthesis C-methylase UbiE